MPPKATTSSVCSRIAFHDVPRPDQLHRPGRAEDVGQDHLGGAVGVVVDRVRVAADAVEEAVHLALRVVEAAGAGPAVGPAVDRLVAVLVEDAAQLAGEQLDRLGPVDLDELVGAPSRVGARPVGRASPCGRRAAATRAGWWMPSRKLSSSVDGAGSSGCGSTATIRPSSTVTRNAPQCDRCGSVTCGPDISGMVGGC